LKGHIDPVTRKKIADCYNISPESLNLLHESFSHELTGQFVVKTIFEYSQENQSYILRVTGSEYIHFSLIDAELHWVNYLADNGVNVARAVPSIRGDLIEIVEQKESKYAVVAFNKLDGKKIDFDNEQEWNEQLFQEYGKYIGRIHRLSSQYQRLNTTSSRMNWNEQIWFAEIDRYLPESEAIIRKKLMGLLERVRQLPVDEKTFGLVHGDAHPWNLIRNQQGLALLDFDYCENSWFVSDIAIALYYAVMKPVENQERNDFARYFLTHFLTGYKSEYNLCPEWYEQIHLFMNLRMISKYVLRYPDWMNNTITDQQLNVFEEWRYKSENNIPYLDVDFSDL